MARTREIVRHRCQHCNCGMHRGCIRHGLPGRIGQSYFQGNPHEICPCIAADDARIEEAEAAERAKEEAVEREENSLRIRLAALEEALWGQSFAGSISTDRPDFVSPLPNIAYLGISETTVKRSRK